MDTVILAAGKGERLDGITAPFLKPLLVVTGRPIVQQAVDLAYRVAQGRVVVVVAPDNAAPISHVLGDRDVGMVVQRRPDGPGRALRLGLLMCGSGKVLVLMGDNISTYADVHRVVNTSRTTAGYAIGSQLVDAAEAERFTYWSPRRGWVEKVPPEDGDEADAGMYAAWVGPLVVERDCALETLYAVDDGLIGPHLDAMIPGDHVHAHVAVTTIDIGVPEALT